MGSPYSGLIRQTLEGEFGFPDEITERRGYAATALGGDIAWVAELAQ